MKITIKFISEEISKRVLEKIERAFWLERVRKKEKYMFWVRKKK